MRLLKTEFIDPDQQNVNCRNFQQIQFKSDDWHTKKLALDQINYCRACSAAIRSSRGG